MPGFVHLRSMKQIYSPSWVESQVAHASLVWNHCDAKSVHLGPQYGPAEQRQRERAYDEALLTVEREVNGTTQSVAEQRARQRRILACFARFSAHALGLPEETNHLLTHQFLPVGTALARWARRFDPDLSMPDIIQACRNAWTACGLQPLFGEPMGITPAILGYSLLYPYSDNYLDCEDVTAATKLAFSRRFQRRLCGESLIPANSREVALWAMVQLIETQYPRPAYPDVFDCLLAIHRAQEESLAQVRDSDSCGDAGLLRLSCAKGGTSVLADACLARGWLTEQESRFSFEWGVLLQLGDDLQDVCEDLERGSITLFSRAAMRGHPLDSLVIQLLNFSDYVGSQMDRLPHGSAMLKDLLRMSWRSLITGAVANSQSYFSPSFLREIERTSPFGFEFLRIRRTRLASGDGLYAALFDAFVEAPEDENRELQAPEELKCLDASLEVVP